MTDRRLARLCRMISLSASLAILFASCASAGNASVPPISSKVVINFMYGWSGRRRLLTSEGLAQATSAEASRDVA